jgi:hypothetical protein
MGPQSRGSPNFWNFRTSNLRVSGQNDILSASPMAKHKEYYKGGRWWLALSPSCGESCESMFVCGLYVHQKCCNYALTNLFFICAVWIIDPLVIHLRPHLKILARLSTPQVMRAMERTPTPYPFVVFTFGLTIESIWEFGGALVPNNGFSTFLRKWLQLSCLRIYTCSSSSCQCLKDIPYICCIWLTYISID